LNPFFETLTPYRYLDLLQKIVMVKRSEQWERETIERIQRERFEALLYHVMEHSLFYRLYYREHGIVKSDIPDLKIEDLPLIDKQIMMTHYNEFVCDTNLKQNELEAFLADPRNRGKKYKERYEVIHTSGSTGHVGIFVYDMRSWNIIKALAITRVCKEKINPFRKIHLAFMGATDGHYAGISLSSDAPNFRPFSVNRPMYETLDELQAFGPTTLCGYASGIYLLAVEQLQGKLSIKPDRIIASGDQLTEKMRQTILDAFGIEPTNFYAASESLCMATTCYMHEGLHLFEDWHCFEVLDSGLKPVKAGESGSLVLTTLYNYAQPLIRYRMHDELSLHDDTCPYGSAYGRIRGISGRSEEFLWFTLPDGNEEYLHPIQIVEFFVPGLEKFQLIQQTSEHLLMRLIVTGDTQKVQQETAKRMMEILQGKKLDKVVHFSTEVVESIAHDAKTGKFRLIIPYKKR